jgi:siroheme synthase
VRSFAFVTPRVGTSEPPSQWLNGMLGADAGAIYMGSHEAAAIAAALIAGGRAAATPVAIVEGASLPGSRVHYTTLGGLPAFTNASLGGPTLLLVGPQFHARTRSALEGDDTTAALLPGAAHG